MRPVPYGLIILWRDRPAFFAGARFAFLTVKEKNAMNHLIEFNSGFITDLEISPRQRLERLRVRKGMRACVGLRPHVLETLAGPVEVADLYFEDGTVARDVRFRQFHFVN